VDLELNHRFAGLVEKHGGNFLRRVFTESEIGNCLVRKDKFACLTARFAAKEAFLKAIGTGLRGVGWKDIEVLNDELGKPMFRFYGRLEEYNLRQVHLSLSHTREQAIAFVVLEEKQ